jgi:hypothetical protein
MSVLEAVNADRLPCCVPHCRRTRRADGTFSEWICGKHWLATSRAWRRRMFLFRRRGRRDLADAMWLRLKRQAIERAGGIA